VSRLSRNVSANVLSNAWATALSLLLTPLYIAFIGVESYGLIGFYMSWTAILGMFDTGISTTAIRETAWLAARAGESAQIPTLVRSLETAYSGILVVLGTALLIAAALFGADWFQAATIPAEVIRTSLMLMVVSLVTQMPAGLYLGGLMGLQRQVEASSLVALFGTTRAAGAVAVLAAMPDIRAFFAWQIVIGAAQTAVMRRSLMRAIRGMGPSRLSLEMLRALGHFAGGMTLVTALSLVVAQMDKFILSRRVSLEVFGLYALAWTVAAGLSRVAAPFLQAFGPHFTELLSRGDEEGLARQVRIASQLTSAIVLPPAALFTLVPRSILLAWVGDPAVAAGAAPLLAVLTIGTLLLACSYPALSVLYSRSRLRPVIALNFSAAVVLLPLLLWTTARFGAIGAAGCWAVYGFAMYVAYHVLGLQGLPGISVRGAILRDFVAPGLSAFAIALVTREWAAQVDGRLALAGVVAAGLLAGWTVSAAVCRDVSRIAVERLRWYARRGLWSA
jgi:O-antigen/teichoic acid export membrane protein